MLRATEGLWLSPDQLEELKFRIQREIDYPHPNHAESIQILIDKYLRDAKVRYA